MLRLPTILAPTEGSIVATDERHSRSNGRDRHNHCNINRHYPKLTSIFSLFESGIKTSGQSKIKTAGQSNTHFYVFTIR